MTAASGVSAGLYKAQIPIIPGCLDFVNMGIIPKEAYTNRKFYSQWLNAEKNSGEALEMLLVIPQTSGGLLIAAPAESSLAIMQAIGDSGYGLACRDIGAIVAGNTGMITVS